MMAMKRSVLGGMALVALGAGGVYTAAHINLSWGPAAKAAPPVLLAEARPALPPPSQAQIHDARSLSRTFAQVASQLSPSVVRIEVSKTAKVRRGANPFHGSPFERFFGGPPEGEDGGGMMEGPKQRGMGSGVVIDNKGHILTNNHVVEEADEVKVAFVDGKTVKGRVVGTDPKSDLAVVKVDNVDVRPAKLGDPDRMAVGDWVIAIGNPFGLDHTVTVGVLSAKNRSGFGKMQYEDFLQTDASINPGNSGGPLVNLEGEVIGINTMIAGMGTGVGFAVPASMARPIADQLIAGGKVRRPYLGILMQDMNPELAKTLGKAPEKGALVGQVTPGSAAEKAGVKPGDVILSVDGVAVDGSKAVQRNVLGKKIGQKVDLTLWRDGQNLKVAATTAELPSDGSEVAQAGGSSAPKAKLGIGLQNLTPELAERLGVGKGSRGAIISSVRPGSPAQEAGLREGDLVLEIDRKAISSADDAVRTLAQERAGGHLLRVKRGDAAVFVVIPQL